MNRKRFRDLINHNTCGYTHTYSYIECDSQTDPTKAMTGAQMFMAAAQGLPIPGGETEYVYTGLAPDNMTIADTMYPDCFDVSFALHQQETEIKNNYGKIKNNKEEL